MSRALVLVLLLGSTQPMVAQQWPQWGMSPQHQSRLNVIGQSLDRNLVVMPYDPLVSLAISSGNGNLLVHYQAPLVDGNDAYMMTKHGRYDSNDFKTQEWGETKYTWQNGTLAAEWTFWSDWKPFGSARDYWEPVFHPALANDYLYVPAAGGSIFKVNKQTGSGIRIHPFPTLNANAYVTSPLTVDPTGNIFYSVIEVHPTARFFQDRDVVDSWLVRVTPADTAIAVRYAVLAAGAPAPADTCQTQFTSANELPWPPSPSAVPPSAVCGTQRPGMNIAPAVAPDGTIYVVTRAHFVDRSAHLIAVNPNLTQKWIVSLRNRLTDGCGVTRLEGGVLPADGAPGGCRAGSLRGVDPQTNTFGSGRVHDSSSSSPVVAPDGSILYGAFTRYNYAQGHLMRFGSDGIFLNAYPFGWDVTPGIYPHDGTWSVLTKENRYGISSYCGDPVLCPFNRSTNHPEYPEGYFITQLNANLQPEWSFRNLNADSCSRNPDGSMRCVTNRPQGFEWCVNGFVIDAAGVVYANSEDGWLYAIQQGGTMKNRIFQQLALGAAYTPTSMDGGGRVYSQNAGIMFVAGSAPPESARRRTVPHR